MTPKLAHSPAVQDESRDAQRHRCAVPTTCQPPSAWSKDPWPATIRDISTGGLSLTLNRRFERGSGLAIELPTEDGNAATVLAKVVHVRTLPEGGWLLGCDFISELSEEEVRHILHLDRAPEEGLAGGGGRPGRLPSITGVLFQARARRGEVLRWYVKRLDLAGAWPLAGGKVVSMHVGGLPAHAPRVEMQVHACRLFGSYWIVDCKLLAVPTDEVLEALTAPPPG